MLKRIVVMAALAVGFAVAGSQEANAQIVYRRVAPVRRVAARAVLPPYPVARAVTPVYRPYYRPVYGGYGYGGYGYYGPGVAVRVGW